MAGLRSVFALLAGIFIGTATFAHDPGLSSARISRNDQELKIEFAFAWSDLTSLLPPTESSTRPDADGLQSLAPALVGAAGGFVQISSGPTPLKNPLPILAPGLAGATEVMISLTWREIRNERAVIDFPVLAKMPFGHRMMITLGSDAEPVALLDARHRNWVLPATIEKIPAAAVAAPASVSMAAFVQLGVEHILTGFDHLCFLFALLLVTARTREVLTVVTTFTVAHSLTLAAAAFGAVSLSSRIVEPLIAASIIYVGLENLILRRQPRYRLAVVFGFGLIHGLGFASGLAERLPGATGFAVVPPLLGFNAGVEFGQLAVAVCFVPLIALARGRPDFSMRLQPVCSLLIAGAGVVWLVQRV